MVVKTEISWGAAHAVTEPDLDGELEYYDMTVSLRSSQTLLVLRDRESKQWYVSSTNSFRLADDIGPFPSMDDAKRAAEMMHCMGSDIYPDDMGG